MSLPEQRLELARQQGALVRSLCAGGEVPARFERRDVQNAATALHHKRWRSVARVWPVLSRSLGERFLELFARYARDHSLPARAGPLADGHSFARWLTEQNLFPEEARLERALVELRFRSCPDGLRPRRGVLVRLIRLRQPNQLLLGCRLPWLGECWWRLVGW